MGPVIQVERWPGRKRKVLCKSDGDTSVRLATFVSDAAVEDFLQIINGLLIEIYRLGKARGRDEALPSG